MLGSTELSVLILALTTVWRPNGSEAGKPDSRLDRSYQLQPIPVINGLQGVHYVPMTALYSGMPTVLVPKQIDVMALHSTPASSVALPSQALLQQQYHEAALSGEDFRSVQEPVLHNVRNSMYSIRKKPVPVYAVKRPTYYNFGRKKIGTHSPYQNQKVSSVSIEQSIDISDQLQQLQGSFPSTTPAPASTYGPAKVLDHQHSGLHVTTYLRPKGHHPHPHYHPKDYRVYTHMHKGHIHNHFIPPTYPIHKSQYHSSAKPVYSVLKPTAASFLGSPNLQYFQLDGKTYPESYNFNSYSRPDTFSTNHIRFPDGELKKSLLSAYKSHQEEIISNARLTQPLKTHSDLTQAFVKEPGTINNYDASIPVKIPSKKPNKFEVKEILRNADVHFIDGTVNEPVDPYQQQHQQQYSHSHYSQFQEFDPSKIAYQALTNGQVPKETVLVNGFTHGIGNNHIDYYDQREVSSSVYGQSPSRDELTSSESLKIPVAVIKGTHSIKDHGAIPIKIQREEQTTSDQSRPKAFNPSSTSSDWIPMSGKAISPSAAASSSTSSFAISSSESKEKYLADLLSSRAKERAEPTRIITSNRNIGDIISGKIPGEYSPLKQSGLRGIDSGSDIITGKIPFDEDSEMDRRKGSVIDENRNSPMDTSNHVVSSMIKFS